MLNIGRVVALAILLSGIFIIPDGIVESAEARCCARASGGCDGASENGCAMGSSMDMFFPDPCECEAGACIDPTQGDIACGGTPGGECGDGQVDGGEDCDEGDQNGTFDSCCALDCSYKGNGSLCEDGVFCDGLGACNGSGSCIENAGGATCPDPTRCDEENRSCDEADAPTVSTAVLIAMSLAMLVGALSILRRRRQQQSF